MKIARKLLYEIMAGLPKQLPETGGIIGGKDEIVTEYWLDSYNDNKSLCRYIPNVNEMNCIIKEWTSRKIEFLGMFHTHYFGVKTLSEGDLIYIKSIIRAMPECIEHLYFPLFVFPEEIMVLYVAYKKTEVISEVGYEQF